MGMLSAGLFQGAAQGLNTLGQGLMRQAERDQEQSIWEKRSQMLAEIQRENARVQREDQAAFDDERFPVRLDQERQTTLARGAAQTTADAARLQNPELNAAQDEAARLETQRQIDAATQKLNNPGLTEAQRQAAERELEQAKRRITELAPAEARRAGMIAGETARAQQAAQRGPDLTAKFGSIEQAIGRPLAQEEKEALAGLGKKGDDGFKAAFGAALKKYENGELKPEDAGAELNTLLRSVKAAPQASALKEAVDRARGDGKVAALVAELRAAGFTDQRMLAAGLTANEIKTASPPASPPKSSGGPGLLDRLGSSMVGMLSSARNEGAKVNTIQRRVREAGQGGPPLTSEELAVAKRFGIHVPR